LHPVERRRKLEKMKKTNLFAILTLAVTPAFLHAQTTNYSSVVGYQTKTVNTGALSVISIPFADAVVTSQVSAATSNTITLQGQTALGSLFNSTDPVYVEITNGSSEGERFDISLSGITSATDTLSINTTGANNTSSFPGASLVGASVVVRKHTTLNSLKSMFSPALKTGTVSTADLIYIFASGSWTPYFLNGSSIWSRSGSLANFNNTVIPPGSAVMFKRVDSTSSTFTAIGTVRGNKFAKNYKAGLGVYAPGFPIAYSPSSMGANVAGGWASGDVIYVLSGATFTPYTFNGTNWKRSGSLANFDTTQLLASDAGILVKKGTQISVLETAPTNN